MSLCTKCQTNEASVNDNTGLCLLCLYPDRGRKGGLLLESFLLADLPQWRPEINLNYGRDPDDQ